MIEQPKSAEGKIFNKEYQGKFENVAQELGALTKGEKQDPIDKMALSFEMRKARSLDSMLERANKGKNSYYDHLAGRVKDNENHVAGSDEREVETLDGKIIILGGNDRLMYDYYIDQGFKVDLHYEPSGGDIVVSAEIIWADRRD